MFDFPPPQVMEVAKQNQITHVKYDKIFTAVNPYFYKVYVGKIKLTNKQECIMFNGIDAHKCTEEEHSTIFLNINH